MKNGITLGILTKQIFMDQYILVVNIYSIYGLMKILC